MAAQERMREFLEVYNSLTNSQKEIALDEFVKVYGVSKESFLMFISLNKLFNDNDYYEVIQKAVAERLYKELHN